MTFIFACNSELRLENGAMPFNLEEYIPELKKKMADPSRLVQVVIVDDFSGEVRGMEIILKNWPRLKLTTHVQSEGKVPRVSLSADIILLDYYLDGITGDYIARDLRSKEFEGVIASISSTLSPTWAYRHFPHKKLVEQEEIYALGFVHYMNDLIGRLEEIRKWK